MADEFDPDAYIAKLDAKKPSTEFDPDAYIAKLDKGKPGKLESLGYGTAKGATFSAVDELAGGLGAIGQGIGAAFGGADLDTILQTAKQGYQEHRDIYRDTEKEAQAANPKTFFAGELGGGIASGITLPTGQATVLSKLPVLAKLGSSRLSGLIKSGASLAPAAAGYGALTALGASEAPMASSEMLGDVGTGAALGGVTGLAAPFLGKGLSKVIHNPLKSAAALAVPGAAYGGYQAAQEGGDALDIAKSAGEYGIKAAAVPLGLAAIPKAIDIGKKGIKELLGVKLPQFEVARESAKLGQEMWDPAKQEAMLTSGVDRLKNPANQVSEKIQSEIAENQVALTEGSQALSDRIERGAIAQVNKLGGDQAKAIDDVYNLLDDKDGSIGRLIGKIKQRIANNENVTTEEVYNFVQELKDRAATKGQLIGTNPKFQQILGGLEDSITKQGIPTEISKTLTKVTKPGKEAVVTESYKGKGPIAADELRTGIDNEGNPIENLFESSPPENIERAGAQYSRTGNKEVTKTTDVANIPKQFEKEASPQQLLETIKSIDSQITAARKAGDIELVQALTDAKNKTLIKGRQQVAEQTLSPMQQSAYQKSNKIFSVLQDLGIKDPEGMFNSIKQLIEDSKSSFVNRDVNKSAEIRRRLTDIKSKLDQIKPGLFEEIQETAGSIQAKESLIPESIPGSKIEGAIEGAVGPGRQTVPLATLKAQARPILGADTEVKFKALEDVYNKIATGNSELDKLKLDKVLSAFSTQNPTNLAATNTINEFMNIIKKHAPELADNILKDPDGFIPALQAIGAYRANLGIPGRVSRLAGRFTGQAQKFAKDQVKPVMDSIRNATPEFIRNLSNKALQSGKPQLSKMLSLMENKDVVARGAILFSISQQTSLKNDLMDITREDEPHQE